MAEIIKEVITPRSLKIKGLYEAGTNGSKKYGTNFELGGELNVLALELVDMLGEITQHFGVGLDYYYSYYPTSTHNFYGRSTGFQLDSYSNYVGISLFYTV